jgi:hypothetical protein
LPPIWVLFAVACVAWAVFLVRPIRRSGGGAVDARTLLLEEKEGYLFALRDAEQDYALGKLSQTDYEAARERLEARAAEALRRLDRLDGGTPEEKVRSALQKLRAAGRP